MSGYSESGGNSQKNILKTWQPRMLSAISDIDRNYELLRDRSGDLMMNSPLGSAAIKTSARSVIGSGLRVFPRLNGVELAISKEEAKEKEKEIRKEFELWSENCDWNRRNNFGELQYIAYVTYLTQGDSFCLFKTDSPTIRNPYELRVQVIEGTRVSSPNQTIEQILENGHKIVNGIEVDEEGRIAGYWISNKVPNDISEAEKMTEWVRVAAYGEKSGCQNILQICADERANQYRGVPYLSAVLETLKQASRYVESELAAEIIKSYFTLFFKGTGGAQKFEQMLPSTEEKEPVVDPSEYKLGVGTIAALPEGVDVTTVDSNKNISTLETFIKTLERQIGAALGIPAEVLTKSFNSSYSASRAALLQFNEEVKMRRNWFIRDFCKPIYETFLSEAVAIGRLKLEGYFEAERKRREWSNAEWYGPAMSILDPKKEIEAAKMRLEVGLSTYTKEAMEMNGLNYESVKEQLKEEHVR